MPSRREQMLFLIGCLVGFGVRSSAVAQETENDPTSVVDSARQYLRNLETQGFSGVVLVRSHGSILLRDAYGYADCRGQRRMTPHVVSDIGSITKAITAVSVLQLVADGRISLGDSIGAFLAGVPPDKAGITVEQLLRHTSGLPEALGQDEDYVDRRWLVEHALAAPLVSTPGTEDHYSNVGYSILGAIIERVTGRSYENVVQAGQFVTAGLHWTGYMKPAWPADRLACGVRDGKAYGATRDYFTTAGPSWHLMANGGIHSTVDELTAWFDALFAGKFLPEQLTNLFVASLEHRSPTVRYLHNSGSNLVFTAEYFKFPDRELVVTILTNNSAWPKEKVMPGLLRRLRPLYAPDPPNR